MNIACDIRVFLTGETGVGIYFRNLLTGLAAADRQNRYLLFSSSWKNRFAAEKLPLFAQRRLVDARVPVRLLNWLWHRFRRPALESFFREEIAVAHSPSPMILPCRGRKIITVHDLFFVTDQELVQPESRRYFRARLSESVGHADGIVCVSQATRSQLLEMFPAAEAKIRVIHHGVAPHFFTASADGEDTRSKYGLPEKYALFIGTIEPRKNLPLLLRALRALKRSAITVPLVIAGSRGWGLSGWRELRDELGDQVHEIGYVAEADLPALYRGAHFFVFPSLAEGFGLPLLEAMASGTQVLCSELPVFREIGGNLPVFFEAGNETDLAAKIDDLWRRDRDGGREERIAHARTFTWQESASRHLDFYRHCAKEPR
jgi:glycosyltransferase involved in cell wall biosynthesis